MKCFLHIGTEKTATTTLQGFLSSNRDALMRHGYMFPKSGGDSDSRRLCTAAYDLNRRDDFTGIFDLDSDEELLKYQQKVIREIKEEVQGFPTFKTIFSSEHFQSRLTKLSEIERLKSILEKIGMDDIRVIVYLRNPSEIANSLYSTAIKFGAVDPCPPPPSHSYYRNICHHKNTLEKFGSVFEASSIIPRIFNKDDFKNGSIIDDFLEVLGLPGEEQYNIPQNKNESLSALGIEILRRFNLQVPTVVNGKINPLRQNIISHFERSFSGDRYTMPLELFKQYDEEFEQSNEWVRRKYFPERNTLFPDRTYPSETKVDIPGDQLDRIANTISSIWIENQSRILRLKGT